MLSILYPTKPSLQVVLVTVFEGNGLSNTTAIDEPFQGLVSPPHPSSFLQGEPWSPPCRIGGIGFSIEALARPLRSLPAIMQYKHARLD